MNAVAQRVEIAESLVDSDCTKAQWFFRYRRGFGRVVLNYLVTPRSGARFYGLTALHIPEGDARGQTVPMHEFFFLPNGEILAVQKSQFEFDEEEQHINGDQMLSALEFQSQTGLQRTFTPDDEANLDRLLGSSIGNPTLERVASE